MTLDRVLVYWGAILSTILAFVKIWEVWQNRRRFEVRYSWIGLPGEGSTIHITNISSIPIILNYWELIFERKKYFYWVNFKIEHPDEFFSEIRIDGHSTKTLKFCDDNDFTVKAGERLTLKIHIAGSSRPRKYPITT